MSTIALIGLGSNLGDRKSHLDSAVAALAGTRGIVVRAVSSFHETNPVGGPVGQPPFLNAAAALETTLDPLDLLHALQEIETKEGRVRSVRWGERTLDIDLLLYGDRVIDTGPQRNRISKKMFTQLRVPHPRMAVRRFVLAPLAEIAPEAIHPLTGRTVASLLANLDRRPSYVALYDPSDLRGPPSRPVTSLMVGHLNQGLVSGLGAIALRRFPMTRFRIDPSKPDVDAWNLHQELLDWCGRLTELLSAERWNADQTGDGWLVSNVWFDELPVLAAKILSEKHWAEFQDGFRESRSRVLSPTFVVAHKAKAQDLAWGRFPDRNRWFPPLGEVPVIEIEPERVTGLGEPEFEYYEVVSDMVATCKGTRAS